MTTHEPVGTDIDGVPGGSVSGPGDLPYRAAGETSAIEGLKARLRVDLPSGLAARIRSDEAAGRPPMTAEDRRKLGTAIGQDTADTHARASLNDSGVMLDADVEQRVIAAVLDEIIGLAGLEPLLGDDEVENININGDRVFVRYADGRRAKCAPVSRSDADLVDLIRELAARSGVEERRFDRAAPIVNFSLADGARVSAVMAVTARPSVSIRRHRHGHVTLEQLRRMGTIDLALESFLAAAVRARRNVLVSGGTAIGKTTMLRALASAIPAWERLVTIEDVFELGIGGDSHPDVVALQAREPNIEGRGAITLSDLVWQALRMSPDRVIVGEVRGPEVIPLTNAMSMGNDGSMGTVHASNSRGAFTKLAAYAVQGPERLPIEATNLLVASALHFVVHLDKPKGESSKRVVSSVREVVDADGAQIVSNEVWRPGPDCRAVGAAPLRTATLDLLVEHGYDPSLNDRAQGWSTP